MRSFVAFAALAAFAKAQDTVTTASLTASVFSIETTIPESPADALDFEGIEAAADPTYTEIPGLVSQVVAYASASAISSAAADVSTDPLLSFPAATDVAMNAAGESDDSSASTTTDAVKKRDLVRRTACAAQPTIGNYYNVDVSSYDNFKADPVIASVANAAPTPAGYWQNFKNLKGANSAYAYLGYSQVKTYDVASCAAQCTKKAGCIAFNIYFERDPTLEPGFNGQCENPTAFANIKCSFWGSLLEAKTATNTGQWRSAFQVGIAGSNSYTSYSVGGPVDGCTNPPLSLDTSVMNAPLRDCQATWTYMGYKLFTSGPYDPRLCKAACDAQSDFDRQHPPTDGSNTAICSAFGSYLLTKTNSSGAYPQGQMCTFYTSAWDAKYAVNKASYDDAAGAKYTYSLSYFYSIPTLQPKCPAPSDCSKPFNCNAADRSLQTCSSSNDGSSSYCLSDPNGNSYWGPVEWCNSVQQCAKNSDCDSSSFCAVNTCCGGGICIPHAVCSNTLAPSRLFRFKSRQEKKRDTTCVSSSIAACPNS